MTDKKLRILIADDHFLLRQGLRATVESKPHLTVVAEASSGTAAVQMYAACKPDLAIIDMRMPDGGGVAAITSIVKSDPKAKVIALSNYEGDEDIHRALAAGAVTYLFKRTVSEELIGMIELVMAGRARLPTEVQLKLDDGRQRLTSRELEVLTLLVSGSSNKEISNALGISAGTVNTHVTNVFSKLGVNDRAQAASVAVQRGIVHLD
jgi:two-component system, NarL family, response regulator